MNSLFNRADIFAVIEHQKQELKNAFQGVTNAELDADPVAVAARLIEQFSINVPVLDEEKKYALTKETQVDVSGDPRRFIRDRSRPFYISGTEVRVAIPFQGDAGLFDVRPTMFTSNPPFGEIHDQELHLVYQLTDPQFDIEAATTRTVSQVKQYLQSMQTSAEQLKTDIQQVVNALIAKRRQERGTHAQILAGLKIPVKQAPASRSGNAPTSSRPMAAGSNQPEEDWDVFISHASEDKDAIAAPLAEALRAKGLRVWYDDFSLKLGDSLRQSIDRGLARSRFGVVILSGHFFQKHWTQQELNGLVTREVYAEKVILPVWHGVGFVEVRNYSAILADRKAVHTKDGLAHVIESIMGVVGNHSGQTAQSGAIGHPNSFAEERFRHVRQVVRDTMTLNGQQLVRWLLLHGRIECTQPFMPEISLETQNRQMEIAVQAGVVQRVEERGSVLRTYYVVNPELKLALERVLSEIL